MKICESVRMSPTRYTICIFGCLNSFFKILFITSFSDLEKKKSLPFVMFSWWWKQTSKYEVKCPKAYDIQLTSFFIYLKFLMDKITLWIYIIVKTYLNFIFIHLLTTQCSDVMLLSFS